MHAEVSPPVCIVLFQISYHPVGGGERPAADTVCGAVAAPGSCPGSAVVLRPRPPFLGCGRGVEEEMVAAAAAGGFSSFPASASGPAQQRLPLSAVSSPGLPHFAATLGFPCRKKPSRALAPERSHNARLPPAGGGQPGPAGGSAAIPGRADFLSLTKWRAFQTCAAIGGGARAQRGGGGSASTAA